MRTVETFVAGALTLIALFLVLDSANTSKVITGLAQGSTNIITALQGRG